MRIALLIIAVLGFIVLNPIGDAIRDNGNKKLQKNLELLRDFIFFEVIYLVSFNFRFTLCLGLSYLFIRIAIHNLIYNLTRGLPWYYTGTTSWSDDVERAILTKADKLQVAVARCLCLLFGGLLFFLAIKYI